jgi:hypothetical protein
VIGKGIGGSIAGHYDVIAQGRLSRQWDAALVGYAGLEVKAARTAIAQEPTMGPAGANRQRGKNPSLFPPLTIFALSIRGHGDGILRCDSDHSTR